MALWRVREFHPDDLDAVLRIWDDPRTGGAEPVFGLAELLAAVRAGQPTVVATVGDEVIGTAVAAVSGDQAWILRVGLAAAWRQRGVGSSLLAELERRAFAAGAERIRCLLPDEGDVGGAALAHRGFGVRPGVVVYDKSGGASRADRGLLDQLGARQMPPGLWDEVGGMVREKEIIERQVILPLAHPEAAERSGLVPPRAVVLFGPPGTGKTTFAKGVAGRLGWPFVELFPSRLATTSAGPAAALRDAFVLVAELDRLVLFIDEVEEIAGRRDADTPSLTLGVTNEMLKLIPAFRERSDRLLVCATNSVRALDAALLRHGRFDYVIPVGPPDAEARLAIWGHYLGGIPHDELDLAALVEQSDTYTPADIAFAARRTAQAVFERSLAEPDEQRATTADVLRAVEQTRPTLTPQMVEDFEQDILDYARL
ncbi:MAG: family N-acetyltransferase [Frankiales bacterium]|jgi:transitional endoplasmic reticulum ATPase|nr:family N-acetyltransferase [Frankiales bacterium]